MKTLLRFLLQAVVKIGLYRDNGKYNGKYNGNYYNGLYREYIGDILGGKVPLQVGPRSALDCLVEPQALSEARAHQQPAGNLRLTA